jgi:hypothetical protein
MVWLPKIRPLAKCCRQFKCKCEPLCVVHVPDLCQLAFQCHRGIGSGHGGHTLLLQLLNPGLPLGNQLLELCLQHDSTQFILAHVPFKGCPQTVLGSMCLAWAHGHVSSLQLYHYAEYVCRS